MSQIKFIKKISLNELFFDKSDEVLHEYSISDSSATIYGSMKIGIRRLGRHDPDDGKYNADMLLDGKILYGDSEVDESESSVVSNIKIGYNVEFFSGDPLDHEKIGGREMDDALFQELSDIIEPYFRETLNMLTTKSIIEIPLLPYNIRRSGYEE